MSWATVIVMGVALTAGAITKASADKKARLEEAKARAYQRRLEAFEASRQNVLNQSQEIRALKSQVFNPYANLAVANKAANQQIEQTDQALANTLDSINRAGSGAGGATALAQMAAKSKAKVSANLENQEANNQKLRFKGEADMQATKMRLEQAALAEEGAAWGRQETRDLATLDRLSGLQENAQAQAVAYRASGDAALMAGVGAATSASGGLAKSGNKTKDTVVEETTVNPVSSYDPASLDPSTDPDLFNDLQYQGIMQEPQFQ
tara:strand:- start:1972 stop:2766 length:795 start_codon:yes stop_codon:yes gene_type:complete